MKKVFTMIGLASCMALNAQWTFSDDLESYTAGAYLAQSSPNWTTWSGAEGGTEDVQVTTASAHGGTKSVYFSSVSATGGPTDLVMYFPSAYNTGTFTMDCWMFVNTGKTAYFNFQQNPTIGQVWNSDFNFLSTGALEITNTQDLNVSTTYPQNAWFHLVINVNLNNSLWDVQINGSSVLTFHNTSLRVASIDIFPVLNSQFYMDDFSFTHTPAAATTNNIAISYIKGASGLAGQQVPIKVLLRNLGSAAISNPQVKLYDGTSLLGSQNFAINIPTMDTQIVTLSTLYTVAVNNTINLEANISAMPVDDNETDDSLTYSFTAISPAAGKMVVAEEGTGSWCQWCPRGAVFMEKLTDQYPGFFQGIAVHNGDPMVVTDYDADIGFTGYPGAMVDRLSVIDPSGMEAPFITRIQIAPKALIVNGARWNATNDSLEVSLTTTFAQAVASGNYKVACVIVEDSVTGSGAGYNQSNAYAGGGQGPMGGYETKPNPVPASQMVYDHVARDISPSFAGLPNAYTMPAAVGYVKTHNFVFAVPNTWDRNHLHIVGLFIDNTGKIDNASSTTIPAAITNGYVDGSGVMGIEDEETNTMVLYPNPTSGNTNLKVVLGTNTEVIVNIYTINGQMISSANYGNMAGTQNIVLATDGWAPGMYLVEVMAGKTPTVMKLSIR